MAVTAWAGSEPDPLTGGQRGGVRTAPRPRPDRRLRAPREGTPRPKGPRQDTGRIAGLDGVRALAIIAVLVFHLRPESLPGGYLGVDVFFVISGFLITTLLARELRANHRIDLKGFWTRRARRLLPALVTVVTVSTALALFAGGDLLVNIGRQVLGALTFSNNWVEISAGSSYFNATAPQLFVNFWSLAVEEQFYLAWPLVFVVVMATTRTGRQRVGLVLGIAACSAAAMALLYTPGQDATRVYYGTDTHLFGLMLGAALALSAAGQSWNLLESRWWRRYRVLVALASLVGLGYLMTVLDPTRALAYRGGILLACLLTAAVLGALPGRGNLVTRLFSVRPLAWVGERSYGIYLWHWPVILLVGAFAPRTVEDSPASWALRGLSLALTLALAAASYRWIENPVRRHGFREVLRRVRAAVGRSRAPAAARAALVASAAVVVVFAVALVTAPEKSQVERSMDAAETIVRPEPAAPGGEDAPPDAAAPAGEGEDSPTDAEQATGVRGTDITGFGDSMLYVAAPGLADRFPGIDLDAESNRQWPAVLEAIRAQVDAGTVRDVVVIAAGTNAGVRDPQVVREALDLLGERTVVLVNIHGSSFWVPESNENLAAVAAEYDNVVVADWDAAATAQPDQLQPDLVHPDMDGMYLFADVVADALAAAA